MKNFFKNKYYKFLVYSIVLVPNIFVIVLGIESFPYTCAPMFTHHIDENTDLFLFKFEGITASGELIDLKDYYGRKERDFMRHFFGKAYGVSSGINPFSNKIVEDSKDAFQKRMDLFFLNYVNFSAREYNLSFSKINLSIVKVDKHRNKLSNYELLGFYDIKNKRYQYGKEVSSINN